MPTTIFPGYPAFLDLAAADLDRLDSVSEARRIVPLTALANLCAQASQSDPSHRAGIMAKAVEFRDQLAVALRAADLMLADVEAGWSGSFSEPTVEPTSANPTPSIDHRGGRKGPRTSRESS